MRHVLVVAEQFFVNRRRADAGHSDGALRPKYLEQMAQRCTVVTPVVACGPGAAASRQVTIKELDDRDFVDLAERKAPASSPTGEVRDGRQVAGGCRRCVPALGQISLEPIDVGPKWPVVKVVDVGSARTMNGAHGDLQTWDRKCTRRQKLCPDLGQPASTHAAPSLHWRRPGPIICA